MRQADEMAVGNLNEEQQRQLVKLLEGVRAVHSAGATPIHKSLTSDGPGSSPAD
jgi:hypothetical protein